MNISDYRPGTAFIILYRKQFKYLEDFENILRFLKLPLNCTKIEIEVCQGEYAGFNGKGKHEVE